MSLFQNYQDTLPSLVKALQRAESVLLCSHINPDGDALGSSLALGLMLEGLGKKITIYNEGPIAYNLDFLPQVERITYDLPLETSFDVTVVLDCGTLQRVGKAFSPFVESGATGTLICIDHHISNSGFGEHSLVIPEASSSGEIVAELILKMGVSFTKDIAESLFCAICVDTGRFKYASTSERTFELASKLVAAGARPHHVSQQLYERRPKTYFFLLKDILDTLTFHDHLPVAWIRVEGNMLDKHGLDIDVTDGIVEEVRSLEFCEVVIFYKAHTDRPGYKVSMRSKRYFDVAALCAKFGGGGHKRASGVDMKLSFDEAHQRIMTAIEQDMNAQTP